MPDESFDPYHHWLGLTTINRPPNHYELLGLNEFESNFKVIEAAVERQSSILRMVTGELAERSLQLLQEVGQAKTCLLDVQSKADYDQKLRVRSSESHSNPKVVIGKKLPPPLQIQVGPPKDKQSGEVVSIQTQGPADGMQSRIESQRVKEKNDRQVKLILDRILWGSCCVCAVAILCVVTIRVSGCRQNSETDIRQQSDNKPAKIKSQKIRPQKKLNRNLVSPLEKN